MCTGVEAALIASAVVGTGSALYSADTQQNAYQAQAKQQQADALAAQQQAKLEAQKVREAAKAQAARARLAMAAAGVSLDSQSALDINKDIIEGGEKDAATTVNDGSDMAARLRAQATASRIKGDAAKVAGYGEAASTALSGYSIYKGV